eukprot:1360217-Amorphochlora_amoeboformis.AAC.2
MYAKPTGASVSSSAARTQGCPTRPGGCETGPCRQVNQLFDEPSTAAKSREHRVPGMESKRLKRDVLVLRGNEISKEEAR